MHMSRKRKASLRARAMEMNEARAERKRLEMSVEQAAETPEETSSVDLLEDLPAPIDDCNSSDEDMDEEDEDYESAISEDEISATYCDWINDMERTDKQKLAMIVYDNYINRFGLTKTAAAQEVGLLLGINDKTVRLWRKDFLSNGDFDEDNRGRYRRYCVVMDEQYRDTALEWVRQHASVKGESNMIVFDFCNWVNGTLLPMVRTHHPNIPSSVSNRTACRWLHKLGFKPSSTRKGVYIDGHERDDVVKYRKLYLKRLEILSSTHAPPPFCTDEIPLEPFIGPQRRNLVLLFHDESTYHSNEDQGWMWAEKGNQPIRPKGLGRGIMVSDFVDEFNGLLSLTPDEFARGRVEYPDLKQKARVLLKYGTDGEGYWNSDKFISQVKDTIKIVKVKYPREMYDVIWLFDHSSGHTAFADDALNATKMNVRPGGEQPKMHSTIWRGREQKMVFDNGTPKGMKQVLFERGINTTKMKADEMREILQNMPDFKYEKTKVEKLLNSNNFQSYFIPKFHCELNPIERVWGQSKKYTRAHCNYSFVGLENTLEQSLDNIPIDTIRRFFRKTRDYMTGYREGLTLGPQMEAALKKYKSHRKVREPDI